MAKKKYLKDENGITRALTTNELGLEKPLGNENYDVNVFNNNMDKIDKGIKGAKDIAESKASKNHTHDASDINGISTNAKGTSFDNSTNGMAATNVQDAIDEVDKKAKNALDKALTNEKSILNLQNELGTNKNTLEANINAIREVL